MGRLGLSWRGPPGAAVLPIIPPPGQPARKPAGAASPAGPRRLKCPPPPSSRAARRRPSRPRRAADDRASPPAPAPPTPSAAPPAAWPGCRTPGPGPVAADESSASPTAVLPHLCNMLQAAPCSSAPLQTSPARLHGSAGNWWPRRRVSNGERRKRGRERRYS
jgi:hypothetical protein